MAGLGHFAPWTHFFSNHWVADVVEVFTTPGDHVWTDNGGPTNGVPVTGDPADNDNLPIGNYSYSFSLPEGFVAAGVFFDWNTSLDIPVLTIFDCTSPDTGCVAAGPDVRGGVTMQVGPFVGQAPAFNASDGFAVSPIVLARDVSGVNAQPEIAADWSPSLDGSSASRTCVISQQATSGTAIVAADCSTGSYTGASIGSDSFKYKVNSEGGSDTATVSVSISTITPPTTVSDEASTTVATQAAINVLANDSDQDGTIVSSSLAVVTSPSHGVATVQSAGVVNYLPDAGFCGEDSFTYTVDDNDGFTSSAATVTISVDSSALCTSDDGTLSGGVSDPDNDGMVSLSDLLGAGISADGGVSTQCIGGCFDYVLTGLNTATATLILPLSEPIPNLAFLRKWDGSVWKDFEIGSNDSFSSAVSVAGVCPGSGYSSGLTVGNNCLQLTISDGGPNDQDGVVNGVIIDPVGVGRKQIASATTDLNDPIGTISGDGCSLGGNKGSLLARVDWAILLGFVSWLGFSRRKVR